MQKIFLTVLSVIFSNALWCQTIVSNSPEIIERSVIRPVVIHCANAKPGDLYVSDLSVDVKIAGNIATTTVDMIFNNKSDLVLEGELEFPLNQNQYLVGYALDINGKMRKGVVVEKEKGRIAFESKVRQGIDPGLVEMTAGNNFKTRVYPLPAKGYRKIQIIYEEELISNRMSDGFKRKYTLPPMIQNKLEKFSFNLTVFNQSQKPVLSSGDNQISLGNWNSGDCISFSKENYEFTKPLTIEIPQNSVSGEIFAEDEGRDTIFYYSVPLDYQSKEKKSRKNLIVYWDVSSSAFNRDFQRELVLLKKYIENKITNQVHIVLFSNDIVDSKTFGVKAWKEIESYISNAPIDGATCFSCLNFGKEKFAGDEILVFSDGINNWNENLCQMGQSNLTLSTISSASSADFGYLSYLAKINKGSFINLQEATDSDAYNQLINEPLRLIKIDYDSKLFGEIYPSVGSEVKGDFSLSGVMKKKTGKINLSFGYGNDVIQTVCVDMHDKWDRVNWNDSSSSFITRLWAQKKITELSYSYEKNKSEIIQLSKKYGIVTKDTSLIVLETAADYAKYEIIPPEELLDEYNRLTQNRVKKESGMEGISINVVNRFNEYKKWWNTKPGNFKLQKSKSPDIVYNDFVDFEETESIEEMPALSEPVMLRASAIESTNATDAMMIENERSDVLFEDKSKSSLQINLQAWNPKSDYISKLKRVKTDKMYETYLTIKKDYSASPSFYMEVADYFWSEGRFFESLRIISNLAEMNLENTDVLRALGNKLCQMGQSKLTCQMGQTNSPTLMSISIFQKLIKIKPEIPLFYRDLALAYEQAGMYQEACDSLYKIVGKTWDSRYCEIEQIAINDMNSIINRHKKEIDCSKYDKRILDDLPVDIRVVLTWNTDDCDIDLWVTDPNNEKCYYGHKLTEIGGRNSRDFTQGYGPEEFCLKSAKEGKYVIEANYYGTRKQSILQPVIVHAEVYTNFGKPNQSCQLLTLQLENVRGNYVVGEITY